MTGPVEGLSSKELQIFFHYEWNFELQKKDIDLLKKCLSFFPSEGHIDFTFLMRSFVQGVVFSQLEKLLCRPRDRDNFLQSIEQVSWQDKKSDYCLPQLFKLGQYGIYLRYLCHQLNFLPLCEEQEICLNHSSNLLRDPVYLSQISSLKSQFRVRVQSKIFSSIE